MKWLINGLQSELPQGEEIAIEVLTDRMVVRSADGVHTADIAEGHFQVHIGL